MTHRPTWREDTGISKHCNMPMQGRIGLSQRVVKNIYLFAYRTLVNVDIFPYSMYLTSRICQFKVNVKIATVAAVAILTFTLNWHMVQQ